MKRVGKAVFYAVAILLFGIFSQQETRAGESSEKHYSRTYSVLSANVGNSYPYNPLDPRPYELQLKLQRGSDEEARVRFWINKLKPDIVILVEAYNQEQVDSVTGHLYSVHGGPYDFICVKNEIGDVIEHVQMPGGDGNSVGYVDVGLKDEGGRKVRLFYAHFPSPQLKWVPRLGWILAFGEAEHKAHVSAFGWIEANIIRAGAGIPCLIAGDLNNDFIGDRDESKYWSGKYIYDQVSKLNLWIFNPLVVPLPLPNGSTERNYEPTYRPAQTVGWKMTIDWVMGKNVVPPFKVPGRRLEIDPVTGTILNSFVTSPPDWWKDTGVGDISRITFDHKPLYGKVVFFWEERIQPPPIAGPVIIEGKYFSQEYPKDYLELRRGRTATWKSHYYVCGVPPEDIRWVLSDNKDAVYLYSRTERRWKREFLIKGNGVLVRSLDGTAWVKEGVSYSFPPEEVSGTYWAKTKKLPPLLPRYSVEVEVTAACWPPERLVLRSDGTFTYTMDPIIAAGITYIENGKWKIEGNRILAESDFPPERKYTFRVLDRNTLIQSNWPRLGYTDWIRQKE